MVGIVILNYIKYEETIKCVESIENNTFIKHHIFIIDNNSPNNSYQILTNCYKDKKNITVIFSHENGGYAKGNNIGVKACIECGIEYAVIANNDIIFLDNSIDQLYQYIVKSKSDVIVGPKIVDNEHNCCSPPFIKRQNLLEYLEVISKKRLLYPVEKCDLFSKVYTVSGCCFIINIKKFVAMKAFDENTFLYNEEAILSKQAENNHLELAYFPKSVVIHNHQNPRNISGSFTDFEILKSGLYYWKKYRNLSNAKLRGIFIFWVVKIILKIGVKKISSDNFFKYLKSANLYLKKIAI